MDERAESAVLAAQRACQLYTDDGVHTDRVCSDSCIQTSMSVLHGKTGSQQIRNIPRPVQNAHNLKWRRLRLIDNEIGSNRPKENRLVR